MLAYSGIVIIHRILTRPIGSLTWVYDLSACVYTWGTLVYSCTQRTFVKCTGFDSRESSGQVIHLFGDHAQLCSTLAFKTFAFAYSCCAPLTLPLFCWLPLITLTFCCRAFRGMHYCVLWLPIYNFTVMFLCKTFEVTTVECVVTVCWKLDYLSHCSHLGYRTFGGHAVECAVAVGPLPWHFCCRVCSLLKTGLFITLLAFLLQDVQGPCSRVCHGWLLKTGSFITLRIFLLQDGQGPWSTLSCGCLIDTCNSMLTWGLF